MHDAILVGVNTLTMDDPRLQSMSSHLFKEWNETKHTVNLLPQDQGLKPPQPIILDSTLRLPLTSRLLTLWNEFNNIPAADRGDKVVRQPWVICGDHVDKGRISQVEQAGVKVIPVPLDDEGMSEDKLRSR
jgi:2,5-diamino-6-(ribosylamino)-4(3H)-pyrimidinone 5'-phosphate reductase